MLLQLYGKHGKIIPLYAIAYAIMNGWEKFCFYKEDYFHVLVFYRLFYKRKNKFPVFPNVIERDVEVWENSK